MSDLQPHLSKALDNHGGRRAKLQQIPPLAVLGVPAVGMLLGVGVEALLRGAGLTTSYPLGLALWVGLLLPILLSVCLSPGLFLFSLVRARGRQSAILAIPATMLVVAGLLFFLTSYLFTGPLSLWYSEGVRYAWTLVFPTALGLGMCFYGDLIRAARPIQLGEGLIKLGLLFFGIGAVNHLLGSLLPWPLYALAFYLSLAAWVYRVSTWSLPSISYQPPTGGLQQK